MEIRTVVVGLWLLSGSVFAEGVDPCRSAGYARQAAVDRAVQFARKCPIEPESVDRAILDRTLRDWSGGQISGQKNDPNLQQSPGGIEEMCIGEREERIAEAEYIRRGGQVNVTNTPNLYAELGKEQCRQDALPEGQKVRSRESGYSRSPAAEANPNDPCSSSQAARRVALQRAAMWSDRCGGRVHGDPGIYQRVLRDWQRYGSWETGNNKWLLAAPGGSLSDMCKGEREERADEGDYLRSNGRPSADATPNFFIALAEEQCR